MEFPESPFSGNPHIFHGTCRGKDTEAPVVLCLCNLFPRILPHISITLFISYKIFSQISVRHVYLGFNCLLGPVAEFVRVKKVVAVVFNLYLAADVVIKVLTGEIVFGYDSNNFGGI